MCVEAFLGKDKDTDICQTLNKRERKWNLCAKEKSRVNADS